MSENIFQQLTRRECELLRRCVGIVLCDDWPWEPEQPGEREALESAASKLADRCAGALKEQPNG